MTWLFEQFQKWFSRAEAEVAEPKDDFKDLPPAIAHRIDQKLQILPIHPHYRQHIHQALQEALDRWQQQPALCNALVVLYSPTEDFLPVLDHALAEWQDGQPQWSVQQLNWPDRPPDPFRLKPQLKENLQQLGQWVDSSDEAIASRPSQGTMSQTLMVVPRLEWCFLRCIEGWEAIEALRDQIKAHPAQFWVLGCNVWAWEYLKTVCQVDAYWDQTLVLPALDGEALRAWLGPIVTQVDWNVQAGAVKDAQRPHSVYEHLGTVSLGVASVAVALWRRSLQYEQQELAASTTESQVTPGAAHSKSPLVDKSVEELRQLGQLQEVNARYPKLPDLTADDRYLLFSLLLHSGMSIDHLALSLGAAESRVRGEVQRLLRQQVLMRHADLPEVVQVNPVYYPRLRTELSQNNFLVGEDH